MLLAPPVSRVQIYVHSSDITIIILAIINIVKIILTIIILTIININSLYCATHKRRGKSDMYSLLYCRNVGVGTKKHC